MCVLILPLVCGGFAYAERKSGSDQSIEYSMARHHNSDTLLFEQVETRNTEKTKDQFVAIQFSAGEQEKGKGYAECHFTAIFSNEKKKQSELTMYHYSTQDGGLTNLSVSPNSVSFDIDTGWFEVGGGTRKIKFVATRVGSSSLYKAAATALWKDMLNDANIIKIEWNQVQKIALKFPTIANFR